MDCVSVYDARTGMTTLIPVEPVTIPSGGTFRLRLGGDRHGGREAS